MDQIDRSILEVLKSNGRATASDISRKVSLSIPAVAERIKKLENSGIIEGYTLKIDRRAAGGDLLAFLLVDLDASEHIDAFRTKIVQENCVLECHHIAGPSDYLLKVAVKDTEELEHFLSGVLKKIPGVISTNTLIRLSTLKETINL